MEALKNIYLRALEGVGEMPSWKKDWRWVAVYSICIYAIVLAFRMSFAGRWDHPELWVNGERILATHDAYFWLAKARGVGGLAGYPLAQIASFINEYLGFGLGSIGFWMPAYVGALVGVICFLWGWLLGGLNAGILAGAIGALTPGFYYRSRLGYFDTDMFTLLAPMVVTWMLAVWASCHLKRGWVLSESDSDVDRADSIRSLWLAAVFGLITRVVGMPHQDLVQFNVLCTFFAAFVVFIGCRPKERIQAFYGLAAFILAAFPGSSYGTLGLWPISMIPTEILGVPHTTVESFAGLSLSVLLVLAYRKASRLGSHLVENTYVCAGVVLVIVASTKIALYPVAGSLEKLLTYLHPAQNVTSPSGDNILGPIYPSIVQSIIEAKQVAISVVMERGLFNQWLAWFALVSSTIVVCLRPAAVFLLPLVVLHIASIKLGVRFSMFGGAALCVFFGVAVFWIVDIVARRSRQRMIIGLCSQVALAGIVLFVAHSHYRAIPITPVVTRAHAEGLIELDDKAPADAMVWTWWDWGYASQYYAGLRTVVDGGRHAGRHVFPVAFSMSTDSMDKANRMIAYSSQYPLKNRGGVGLAVDKVWNVIPRNAMNKTLDAALALKRYPIQNKQYLVVTWKDFTIAKWITYFGNWNLETGKTQEATISNYDPGQLGFNIQQGAVMNRKGGGGLVSDITTLDAGKAETTEYYMNKLSPRLLPKKRHLVINKVSRQSVLMDRVAYRSTMARLLIGDPNAPEISTYFKLVVDKLPFARIYEVVQ